MGPWGSVGGPWGWGICGGSVGGLSGVRGGPWGALTVITRPTYALPVPEGPERSESIYGGTGRRGVGQSGSGRRDIQRKGVGHWGIGGKGIRCMQDFEY